MSEVLRDLEGLLAGQAPAPAPGRELAVAVMAFTNVTGRLDDAWLGTGLAETVAAGLSAVGGLSVVSRERIVEVLRGLGLEPDASDLALAARVGRETGARVVVSGSYQCLGDRIRATARVVETATDRVTFSTQIDGTREGIFDVQDRLVADLVSGFRAHVSPARPGETLVLEAYEAFSKGLLNFRDESQESIDRAIVYFERAASVDPAYARAHLMLGAALDLKGDYLTTPELSERALASLDRALALGADPAEVWRYRGSALLTLGRDGEAIDAYERALALNPMDASSQSGIGRVQFILRGDFAKAVVAYERALAINPRAGWSAMQLAHCATFLREFSRAESAARLAVTLQRTFLSGRTGMVIIGAHMRLGHAFALQGRHREALEQYGLELEFVDAVGHALRGRIVIELQQRIGESRIRLGEEAAGRAALDLAVEACRRRVRTGADDPMSPYYGACACALLGDTEEALALLELAAAKRPRLTAARAAIEPALEALRLEPRFRAIVGPLASADDR
jgi:tetratricopeptide (TPR) repeat protein